MFSIMQSNELTTISCLRINQFQLNSYARRVHFQFLLLGSIYHIFLLAKSEKPDQTSHSTVSDLGLHCLRMCHKKDNKVYWLKHYNHGLIIK